MEIKMADSSNSGGGGRTASFLLVALVAALLGAAAAHFAPFVMGHGGHHRGGGWGDHGGFRHEMSVADMQEHIDGMVKHFARHADATEEQQTKLAAIAKAAVADLQPLHQQLVDAHKKALDLFRQPTIDRTAFESLRAEQIARLDTASKRLAQAMTDMAEVLTPEQRAKLADRITSYGPHDD
jgi:Spy/CpxP family protein refolding chaperone